MKKFIVLIVSSLMLSTMAWADDEDIKQVDPKTFPPITHSIISSYFPGTQIVEATKSKKKVRNSFNVVLDDGSELEFDKDGQWKRVYRGGNPIPRGMLNLKIANYLDTFHPDVPVVLMEKVGKGYYHLQLADDTELTFDNQFRLKE